ncbi:enoyl-CoA hydratase/isomerase family protein [Achromobacter aegrifaciens]
MSSKKQLVYTEQKGDVFVIRLDDPSTRNALSNELRVQLGIAVTKARSERKARTVYLTGTGPTFCSGGHLTSLKGESDPWSVHRRFQRLSEWLMPLIQLDKPVVVGVNGHAVGGGMGLALTGDVMVAAESASFSAGFFRLGVVPDIGMMYHLPRLIGLGRTKAFLFRNGELDARTAEDWGIVAKVVPDAQLEAQGMAEAERLAAGPVDVMGLAKVMLARTFETGIHDMFSYEGLAQALAMSNPEFAVGLESLLARQKPDFASAS